MKLHEYKYLILSDCYRVTGSANFLKLLNEVFWGLSYKYIFWMRTCKFSRKNKLILPFIYPISRYMVHHYTFKFGISIPFNTDIGSGFYIGHFGGIFISEKSKIGKNCNVSQGVTIGQANRGRNKGYPTLADNIYIGPGAKIIGAINIGNNVAIGANCVVTKNIPDNAVVVGVPGEIISYNGSKEYIKNTEYENLLS